MSSVAAFFPTRYLIESGNGEKRLSAPRLTDSGHRAAAPIVLRDKPGDMLGCYDYDETMCMFS